MKSAKMIIFIALFLLMFTIICPGQDRGVQVLVKNLDENAKVGKQIVVLIAINNYDNWVSLQNPVKDAKALKKIIENRYYVDDVVELFDKKATKGNILKLFTDIQLKVKKEDSLFIFYAGHGHLDSVSNTGFWIPSDAGIDVFTQENWIPNSQIRGILSNIESRHVCLISDACFSGDILDVTRSIQPKVNNEYFKKAYSRVSRQVLTSGSSETVPDYSEFCRQLLMTLENNTNTYLDPLMLYNEIRLGMTKTTPLLGNLKQSGHQDGASFLFFLKEIKTEKETIAVTETPEEDISITIKKNYGSVEIDVITGGEFYIDGEYKTDLPEGSNVFIEKITVGSHEFEMKYAEGVSEKKEVKVKKDTTINIKFELVKKEEEIAHKEEDIILPGGFFDDFNAPTLDGRWYWVKENPEKWSLTKKPGYLSIFPEHIINVLLTDTTEINFQIDVKIKISHFTNSSQAGIVVLLDKETVLSNDFYGNENSIILIINYDYGRGKQIGFIGKNEKYKSFSGETIYLRIVKKGGKFTGFYSLDEKRFKVVGEYNQDPGKYLKFGLFGKGPPSAAVAYFDSIRFSPIAE